MKIDKNSALFSLMDKSEKEEDCRRIIPYIDKFLLVHPYAGKFEVNDEEYVSTVKSRKDMHFHPSGDCMKCQRLLYFERDDGVELHDNIDAHLQSIFKIGSVTHAMIQAWFTAFNKLDGFPNCIGNEVRIHDIEANIGGYIDSMIQFPDMDCAVPIEIKTINDYGFQSLAAPKTEHRLQIGCYIMETKAPFGIVLYYNKNTSQMKEFRVEPMDMMNVLMRWEQVRQAVDNGDISSLSYGCKKGSRDWERCPARNFCYRY